MEGERDRGIGRKRKGQKGRESAQTRDRHTKTGRQIERQRETRDRRTGRNRYIDIFGI